MKYNNIVEATFLERPNRFIAYAKLGEKTITCHVKNTGRCREILIPGKTKVYLEDHGENTGRKTRYSLVKVVKGDRIINIDSQAPNQIVEEWISQGGLYSDITFLKREYKYDNSRFDIYYERQGGIKGFVEVKGVTLEEDNVARFPDAPTERGVKHIYELMKAKEEGYEANIVFVIQMEGIRYFTPNDAMHKEFGQALREAKQAGVNVVAVECNVTTDQVNITDYVEVFI